VRKSWPFAFFDIDFLPVGSSKAHTTTKTQPHNTQQPKWAAAALPSSGFSPLPPWVSQRRHQIMALLLPMVPCKARAIVLGGATVGSPVWGTEMQPIDKIE
jgi:hypothetical protein